MLADASTSTVHVSEFPSYKGLNEESKTKT